MNVEQEMPEMDTVLNASSTAIKEYTLDEIRQLNGWERAQALRNWQESIHRNITRGLQETKVAETMKWSVKNPERVESARQRHLRKRRLKHAIETLKGTLFCDDCVSELMEEIR